MTKQNLTTRSRYRYRWLLAAFWSLLLTLTSLGLPQSALAEISKLDKAAIDQTRNMALQALNTRDFSKIEPYLHPTFTITTVDNRTFHKVPEFEQYWNQQLKGPIKEIALDVTVDTPRTFLSPQTAVSHGDANSTFYFTDGNSAKMPMRWTAVLQKVQNIWTIQSLHFSASLLDNPVLSASQFQGRVLATIASVGGLLVGAVGMWLLRR